MAFFRLALMAAILAQTGAEEMLADDVPPLSRDPDVTASGCTCESVCGASLNQGAYRCDWCYTNGKCGTMSVLGLGYWDFCVYPKMVAWEQLTYQQKENKLWNDANAPESRGKSSPLPAEIQAAALLFSESMITAFDDQWDVLPQGRSKVIHHQGVLCKFDLDITSKSFTGLLAGGKTQGIIRMGSATPTTSPLGMQPGFAVKFLRSGVPSANFVALTPDPSRTNYDFFARNFSNQAAPAKALQITGKFQQASGCINQVGLSDVCKNAQDGTAVASPMFPYEINFEPTAPSFPTDPMKPEELMRQLSSIPVGTQLFNVYTHSSPAAMKNGQKQKLGTLTTTSECVASLYGDNKLFFRHQRMEEDFALRPEWIKDGKSGACDASNKPISTWQCAHVGEPMLASNVSAVII